MVQVNRLRARMLEQSCSMERLSEHIGVHISTLYRKMRAPESMCIWEVEKIREALGLSREQMLDIFFGE